MENALAAFKFLTLGGRFDAAEKRPEQIGKGAVFFPLVGLLLGLVLALVNGTLEPYLESEILGVALMSMWIVMTGAMHLEGMQKTFDELPIAYARSKPVRVYGFLALLIIVLFKIRATEVAGEARTLSLLLTPVFARWSLVIFLYGSTAADESARAIAEKVRAWHLLVTTTATLIFAVFLVGRTGLWIGLYLSLFALLTRTYLHRRHGGVHCDNFGALIELSEALSLILFASL
jgi:adenosylcobinamide-GDP ribazoletransferase